MIEPPVTLQFSQLDELDRVAEELLQIGKTVPVWLFEGHMGAGKTTLIKSLCSRLGVSTHVQSPTFSLVNEYEAGPHLIYHFDFYRIKDESEALDMGVEEYLYSGDFCFIEWPGKISGLWPEHYLHLDLSADENGARTLQVRKV